MPISFAFKNDVQYIKLDGGIATVEEAAIRLKLDQKINQGRQKILFDITSFNSGDKNSVEALQSVVKFALYRGVTVGLFGLKQSSWVIIAENFPVPMKIFEIESEAIKWIGTIEIKPSQANGQQEKKLDPEAEYKQRKLKELLTKYELYQVQNDYDPFLLRKLEEEYRLTLVREPLFALRRAYKHVFTLKDAIAQIDAHCRQLADQLLTAIKIRKIPLSPAELVTKEKAIQDVRASVEAEVNEVKGQIDQHMAYAVELRKKMQALEDKWKSEVESLQKQIETQKQENSRVLADLNLDEKS
jgi:hypothetical protein